MKNYHFTLSLLSSNSPSPQPLYQSEPTVRVRILNNTDTFKILFNNDWLLTSETISKQFVPEDGEIVFTIEHGGIKIAGSNDEIYIPR